MKNRFAKIILLALCVTMLLSAVPAGAAGINVDDYKPDPWYSDCSNTGDELVFPREREYLSTPYVATVYAIQRQISIYLMPMPQSGHGNLGTVGHGKRVLILAKSGGFLFFLTQDGRYGWNGAKYFDKVSNSSAYYSEFPTNSGRSSRPALAGPGWESVERPADKLEDGIYFAKVVEVWTTNDVDKAKFEIMEVEGYGPSDAVVLRETGERYSYNLHRTTIIDGNYLSSAPSASYRSRGERVDSIYDLIDRYGELVVEITIRDGKLTKLYNYYKP